MVAQSSKPGAHVLSFRAFRIELEFRNVGFCGEGKTGVPGEKPLGAEKRTNNKLNPHMTSSPGIEPGPHWWKASALTTAPSLVAAKSRVAPLKELTITQLELQAAVLASRLQVSIKEECCFQFEETFLCTDSAIVLAWLRSTARRYKPFMSSRVGHAGLVSALKRNNQRPQIWRL